MRTVVVEIRKGPLEGTELQLELGHVVLGREPGPGGILLSGDQQISRRHGELLEERGQLIYRNLSANGTWVNRELIRQQQVLRPGAELRLGDRTLLELRFEASEPTSALTEIVGEGGNVARRGPLAKPLVRALLLTYILGVVALGLFFHSSSSSRDDFEPVREDYALYRPAEASEVVLEGRLTRAAQLARRLEAFERRESWTRARATCRELMALDSDPDSPIYRFAARRLGELAGKGGSGS